MGQKQIHEKEHKPQDGPGERCTAPFDNTGACQLKQQNQKQSAHEGSALFCQLFGECFPQRLCLLVEPVAGGLGAEQAGDM